MTDTRSSPDTEPVLSPCPLCGGEMMFRKALWPSGGNVDSIIHDHPADCGLAEFSDGTIDESIIARWNSRASQPATPTIDTVPSCGSENDYRRATPAGGEALRLLQASSCFRGEVCASLPCACAESLAAPSRSSAGIVGPDGYNGCYRQAIAALSFLASHERPSGGEQDFNAAHLLQIADEMKRSRRGDPAQPSRNDVIEECAKLVEQNHE